MLVYKIINKVDNKCYVGITKQTLEKRWQGHIARLNRGDTRHLYNAMKKYGLNNFEIIKVDNAKDYDELLEKKKILY